MVKAKVSAESFLKNMGIGEKIEESIPKAKPPATLPPRQLKSYRSMLKHFGGYIGTECEEQIAILRARLKLDNSRLIERAIRDLYDREIAARKFGDR